MFKHSTQYKERIEKNKMKAYLEIQKSKNRVNTMKKDFFGASYNLLIGHKGYPNLNVGLLSVDEKNEEYDNPFLWKAKNYGIPEIMGLRSSLVNSQFKTHIKSFDQRLMEISKEVSLSQKPVDVEVNLNKKPIAAFNTGQDITPYGPSVKINKATITENPKIPQKVEKVVDDDLKATEGLRLLRDKGFDEHYLTKIFSMGNLGLKKDRKLVPTRWSITATDDTLGKQLITEVKKHPEMDYQLFYGGHMGNHYLVLCFPEPWSYELFEIDLASHHYGTDYEPYQGRVGYATETVGGYYASRLAVLEKLKNMKRQGSMLVLRFISSDYWMSMGVWVVRESVREAMSSKSLGFSSRDQLLRYVELFTKRRFNLDVSLILKKSVLLKYLSSQKKLAEFFL